jgi:hypothetical protein
MAQLLVSKLFYWILYYSSCRNVFLGQNVTMFVLAGLQNRCGSVFALLAAAACPDSGTCGRGESPGRHRLGRPRSVLKLLQKQHKLHTSHALSMDVLLGRGLELGSHSPDCWTHVFRSVDVPHKQQKAKGVSVDWMINSSLN